MIYVLPTDRCCYLMFVLIAVNCIKNHKSRVIGQIEFLWKFFLKSVLYNDTSFEFTNFLKHNITSTCWMILASVQNRNIQLYGGHFF
jgi:hypothetical protein